jgi:hypothetical protein
VAPLLGGPDGRLRDGTAGRHAAVVVRCPSSAASEFGRIPVLLAPGVPADTTTPMKRPMKTFGDPRTASACAWGAWSTEGCDARVVRDQLLHRSRSRGIRRAPSQTPVS